MMCRGALPARQWTVIRVVDGDPHWHRATESEALAGGWPHPVTSPSSPGRALAAGLGAGPRPSLEVVSDSDRGP